MRTLRDRPIVIDPSPLDTEVLIEEARRRQRRRWISVSIILTLALVGGVVYAVSSTPPGGTSNSRTNASQQPYFAGSPSLKSDIAADVPDLLRPESITVVPNGDLLIADRQRNQIFERNQRGQLKLIAGTGQDGFGGDGGSAQDAELGTIGGIALSPSGTLYVAESDYGSPPCRLRAITDGRIRTVTTDCIGSLQIGPKGALYGSYGPGIYRISPNAQLSLIAGGPNKLYPQASPEGSNGGNVPLIVSSFAFEANGDLIIYDFGNYQIDRITPSGAFSEIEGGIGAGWGSQLATLPDGSVLVAMDGGLFQRIAPNALSGGTFQQILPKGVNGNYLNVGPTQVTGFHGAPGDWFLNGLAIAPNGTIYTAGNNQSPKVNATVLVRISPSGHGSVLPITTPLRATLPALGTKAFPLSLYPVQVPSSGSQLSSCPNPRGVESFDAKARAAIRAMFSTLRGNSFFDDLALADRSWWPGLFESLQDANVPLDGQSSITSIAAASSNPFAQTIAKSCGTNLVKKSVVVTYSPSPDYPQDPAPTDHFFVLDRGGHPLLYLQGS